MSMVGSGVVFSFVITTNFSVNTPEIPFSRYKHPFILYIKAGVEMCVGVYVKFIFSKYYHTVFYEVCQSTWQ